MGRYGAMLGAVVAAMAAAGCGQNQTADAWVRAKLFPPPASERFVQLTSDQADQRREAFLYIQKHPDLCKDPKIVRAACRLARECEENLPLDRDPDVMAAREHLRGAAQSPETLLASDAAPAERREAALVIGGEGTVGGLAALVRAFRNDKDAGVRAACMKALRGMQDTRALDTLVDGLGDADGTVSFGAWLSLRYMTGAEIIRDARLWQNWVKSAEQPFARYGDPPPVYIEPDPMTRAVAVETLGHMTGEDVVPTLRKVVMGDSNPFVRTDAATALGKQGAVEGLEVLRVALSGDKSVDVRVAAAEALCHIRDKRAAETLVVAVGDTDVAVARTAWEGLRYMTGQSLPMEAEAWRAWLAAAEEPLAHYGKAPPMPKGESQRPQLTQGVGGFIEGLFKRDVREAELD